MIPELQCIPYNVIDFPTRFIQGTYQFFNISCFLIDYKFGSDTYAYALTRVNSFETLTSKAFTTSNTYQRNYYYKFSFFLHSNGYFNHHYPNQHYQYPSNYQIRIYRLHPKHCHHIKFQRKCPRCCQYDHHRYQSIVRLKFRVFLDPLHHRYQSLDG